MVALIGVGVALAANQLSPRGISLSRDYFPQASPSSGVQVSLAEAGQISANANAAGPQAGSTSPLRARLAEQGLQLIPHQRAAELFRDDRFAQGLIVFVDARSDKLYQTGHVPGAFQLDHYRLENYVQEVLPVCLAAEEIVVYCNGGECEDSVFAAIDLQQLGVPSSKLRIYEGGMNEWKQAGLPVATGPRGGGVIKP